MADSLTKSTWNKKNFWTNFTFTKSRKDKTCTYTKKNNKKTIKKAKL